MIRDSFIFYRSFYEAIKEVPKKNRAELYDVIMAYVFEAREEPVKGVTASLWHLIKPLIDANNVRYEHGKLGGQYGKRGGRPKKTETEKNPSGVNLKTPVGLQSKTPNVNVNVNENENVNVNANVNANENGEGVPDGNQAGLSGAESEREIPSFKEVVDEVTEHDYKVSASRFWEYYNKNGWRTTEGEPIRNWKSMLKVWDAKEKGESPAALVKSKNKFNNFDQRTYNNDELEAMLLDLGGAASG